MTRDNLTPTVVTDKNGKVTTVHKKTAGAFKQRSMPSPEAAKVISADKLLVQRVKDATWYHFGNQDEMPLRAAIRMLGELAEPFVELVEKAQRDSEAGHNYGNANLSFINMELYGGGGYSNLRMIAQYRDVLPENVAFTDMRFTIRALAERWDGDQERWEWMEQVRAHLYAASVYERPSDNDLDQFDYESNQSLFDMVMRRPAEVEEIMRVHNTYKPVNMSDEVMEECLRTHPSIGQGIL